MGSQEYVVERRHRTGSAPLLYATAPQTCCLHKHKYDHVSPLACFRSITLDYPTTFLCGPHRRIGGSELRHLSKFLYTAHGNSATLDSSHTSRKACFEDHGLDSSGRDLQAWPRRGPVYVPARILRETSVYIARPDGPY